MTIAEQLREEGRKEGRKDGRKEAIDTVAVKLLRNGCEVPFVALNTGLSIDRCKQLQAQVK